MRTRWAQSIGVLAVVAAVAWAAGVARPGQGAGFRRAEDGRPDLNGIWQAFTTANWDIEAHHADPGPHPEIMGAWGAQPAGLGIVEGGEIPYTPEALATKQEHFRNRMTVKVTNDPHRFDTGDPELQCCPTPRVKMPLPSPS